MERLACLCVYCTEIWREREREIHGGDGRPLYTQRTSESPTVVTAHNHDVSCPKLDHKRYDLPLNDETTGMAVATGTAIITSYYHVSKSRLDDEGYKTHHPVAK